MTEKKIIPSENVRKDKLASGGVFTAGKQRAI